MGVTQLPTIANFILTFFLASGCCCCGYIFSHDHNLYFWQSAILCVSVCVHSEKKKTDKTITSDVFHECTTRKFILYSQVDNMDKVKLLIKN